MKHVPNAGGGACLTVETGNNSTATGIMLNMQVFFHCVIWTLDKAMLMPTSVKIS
jgi:hypothetical protein